MPARLVPDALPVISPLQAISPTLAVQMRHCLLRAAFARSSSYSRLASRGPATRLGIAAHAVLEAVGKGALEGKSPNTWRAEVEQLWDSAVQAQARDAAESLVDTALGPPDTWKHFYLRRAQVRRLALALAHARQETHSRSNAGEVTTVFSGAEVELHGFDDRLRGRVDHIDVAGGSPCIEDYKSGPILEVSADGDPAQIKDDYRIQLLIYAALLYDTYGTWAKCARLIPLEGSPVGFDVDPDQALEAARTALGLLRDYNASAVSDNIWDLARPNPGTCRSCGFRGTCQSYWEAASADWQPAESVSCEGCVRSIERLGDSTIVLTVDAVRGTIPADVYRVRGLKAEQIAAGTREVAPGDLARLVLLWRREGALRELWAGASTEVWLNSH